MRRDRKGKGYVGGRRAFVHHDRSSLVERPRLEIEHGGQHRARIVGHGLVTTGGDDEHELTVSIRSRRGATGTGEVVDLDEHSRSNTPAAGHSTSDPASATKRKTNFQSR